MTPKEARKMAIAPKRKMIQFGFRYPEDLHLRVKKLRDECDTLGLVFDLQPDFIAWLERYLEKSEAELAKYKADHPGGVGGENKEV